ncbi:L-threonylcarbamoyladenylate synthase [Inmirania thermothiophila]|uniref:tRNA threonylcarbamoyl adenosine modification protein (Sua5/YciO/YrdC/YwlC family) n=1 Tax=Inmirania thermothiophila TaxID=1750597 RepID=A0A3N1Y0B1_9GAMM|nr:L-threonylcarbamoyladenylate synthase [Inmirania thermothiophila]ROR32259.1 tRNA threonylcarbamoyl adenosine modification protein (Sua5/YciO/YrdC/YwlC family) [Inmirania thermothiophila]
MSQYFEVHPRNPQPRLIRQAAEILRRGGVIAYPTDATYALGCRVADKAAVERIRAIRRLDSHHELTLVCRDLGHLATYAKVDNTAFRILRALTPGPYTFILRGTREVPRRLLDPRRRTVGLRVPDHPVVQALVEALGEPLMSTTAQLPGEDRPLTEPCEIRERLGHALDLVLDAGAGGIEPTTVVDMTGPVPEVVRVGAGDPAPLLA